MGPFLKTAEENNMSLPGVNKKPTFGGRFGSSYKWRYGAPINGRK